MTVMAAPLTASCLLPDEAPPALSNNLDASAIAMLISWDWEPPPLELLPPDVNFFRTCGVIVMSAREPAGGSCVSSTYLHSRRAAHGPCAQVRGVALVVRLIVRVRDVLLVEGLVVLALQNA